MQSLFLDPIFYHWSVGIHFDVEKKSLQKFLNLKMVWIWPWTHQTRRV